MYSRYPGQPRFVGCQFVENVAPEAGGALYIHGTVTVRLTGCTFARNTGGVGAALSINEAQVALEDCAFIENVGEYNGGALIAFGDVTLSRCRFDANESWAAGGAIFINRRLTL